MRASLARLLEHGDRQRLAAVLFLQLREPKRRGQSRGAAADDQDVDVERFALHERHEGHEDELATKITKNTMVFVFP